ncbi:DUF6580 family putative transport protein [Filimonas effusa]|uniref:Uncharacterized protein n=1 Tax=Filimonas effusa TaxID=2508721 RepID=A0A4Q1DEW9_9BACT|nr:DUF6580 family putative transport protein [Filimonas effusa]RXK87233.1 hypothetical protein ESB13_10760 [Filimonas effusa]
MKSTKSIVIALCLLIVVAAVYRVFPNRPWGFTPQYAMAIFSGAIFIKNKKWAFALPIISMFVGDLFYHGLYNLGMTNTPGFYEGQWQNYLLFALLTSMGFLMKKINVLSVLLSSVAAPTVFFILSNFVVWAGWQGTRGLNRPRTFEGLMMAYNDAIPFTFPGGIYSTLLFSAILFGGYFLIKRAAPRSEENLQRLA